MHTCQENNYAPITMHPDEMQDLLDIGLDRGILTVEQWRNASNDLKTMSDE